VTAKCIVQHRASRPEDAAFVGLNNGRRVRGDSSRLDWVQAVTCHLNGYRLISLLTLTVFVELVDSGLHCRYPTLVAPSVGANAEQPPRSELHSDSSVVPRDDKVYVIQRTNWPAPSRVYSGCCETGIDRLSAHV
jgi:hypothetical protein